MKIEYEKAVEAARDVIYGDDQSHIKTRDALENLLAAIEAQEPLFILYTGEVWDGEQDDWDVEPNGQAAVDDYCAANPGKRIGLFPCPPAQPGVWARALRLADEAAESVICTEGQIQRPGVWRITREVLDADRAYLSDCLQHLAWRQMADVAEDHNTGDVIVTFRGEHPADSEATPALPTEQWRSD